MQRPLSQTQAATPPPSQRNHIERSVYGAPLGTYQYPPPQGAAPNINLRPNNQTLKANINIATLNINGFTAPSQNMNGIEKWSAIYQTMKENKIAVLAMQETHLDNDMLQSINECFGKRLTVINSKLPENPRSSAGVAFAINRALVAPKELTISELIKGRAMTIKFKWHDDEEILLLNIYAPNNRSDHPNFWEEVDMKRHSKGLRRPDIMLGDFNLTEDPIDRALTHLDDTNAIAALRNLRQCLGLEDSWRHAFPHDRNFTYRATCNGQAIMSRLDRIYTSSDAGKATYDWKFVQTSVPTDHWLVMAKYAPNHAPYIGKGRWTMQLPELKKDELMNKVIQRGIALQNDLKEGDKENIPEDPRFPQRLWTSFKEDVTKIAKKHCSASRGKLTKKIKDAERKLKDIINDPELDSDNTKRANEAYLAKELANLKRIQEKDKKDELRAVITNHGEVLGGVWSGMNKERKPRDLLCRLRVPNNASPNPIFERDSRRMAKLARDYHEALQEKDITVKDDDPEWDGLMAAALNEVRDNQRPSPQEIAKTDWLITYPQVWNALKLAKNGTATGLDGCPYELWKELDKRYEDTKQQPEKSFDIVGTMTLVFQNIQMFGIGKDSNFANGWMCPIYKKKDPTDISNYRPITLLNTDYKLMTKTLALQLVEPIHKMIHPDQAGFIPKRSIFNHIRLVSTIINYAEVMEVDGVIVALDQEKAYDKIRHKYLWEAMRTFNLPEIFINTTKSLYENAFTQVAINGVLSDPFKVTRGVRQGDPLSCLLFDLAIEPLACKMRNSNDLEGLSIPGIDEKLIVNLFVDDTTVYLNKRDRFDNLEKVLKSWCEVSGAKFNMEKTEIIPIGTKPHRERIVDTRKINPEDEDTLDQRIHVAKDGEPVRSLGAWIGNKINDPTPWEIVLDKIKRKLNLWAKSNPTLYGKRLIIQAIVGGHTQFLAKAQGMPAHIEEALIKIIRDYVWDNDIHPRIALDYLHYPLDQGGLNILDITSRNEAIELVWLRDYLNLTTSRQPWAIVTDILINVTAPPGTSAVAVTNAFLQSWHPPSRGPRMESLNEGIVRMLRTARKYKTNLAAIRLSPGVKASLPAWYHPYTEARPMTNIQAKCLLNNHAIKTVADLIKSANKSSEQAQDNVHITDLACICMKCVHDRRKGCRNPHACALEAETRLKEIAPKYNPIAFDNHDTLSLTPNRKAQNSIARRERKGILFDPTITCKDGIAECFRVFTDPEKISRAPACRRPQNGTYLDHLEMKVYTDGSCINNGKLDAKCGSGIWLEDNHPLNKSVRVPGKDQSNQVGEIAAVVTATETLPNYCKLTIITDSEYVIEGLTHHLGTWEDNGWIGIKNAEMFKRAAYLLKKRTAPTYFEWVKGHQGNLGNEKADELAKEGAYKNEPDHLSLHIPKEFDLQGAKLATLSQAIAYRGIRGYKTRSPRAMTDRNMDLIREAIKTRTGEWETNETIWKSIRKRTIRLHVQQFLFKAIHNTPMVGKVWFHIQGHQERGTCTPCRLTENMEHILVHCQGGHATKIWNLARALWPYSDSEWPEITLGTILGSGCLSAKNTITERNELTIKTKPTATFTRGPSRLLQIIVSEAAHLIWVLRCERVIRETHHSPEEAEKRWYKVINRRLTDDKITATIIKRDIPHTQLVEATWEDALRKLLNLPKGWIKDREVLVGRSE